MCIFKILLKSDSDFNNIYSNLSSCYDCIHCDERNDYDLLLKKMKDSNIGFNEINKNDAL